MTTLLLAEHREGTLDSKTFKTLSAAMSLEADIHLLIVGYNCQTVVEEATKLSGVKGVLVADDASLEHQLAESVADLIVSVSDQYNIFIAAASSHGKNIMPRVASMLDVMQVSDVTAVIDTNTFERPIYAGNAIQTVRSIDDKKVVTVRTSAFEASDQLKTSVNSVVVKTLAAPSNTLSSFVRNDLLDSELPDLASAKRVVAGGRGFGSKEKFNEILLPLANSLGAAIGASRAVVDSGYAPNDWQIGQTGKVVSPELYIACGISGAIQHVGGIMDSKVIVAINNDEEAPIFEIADYGLVGDIFKVLPELQKTIESING